MDMDWLADGRKIPDDVMFYIRIMAVYAVRVQGHSPEVVAQIFNFNRPCIYRWLKQYDEGGYPALKSDMPTGAKPLVGPDMDDWLKNTVLSSTPLEFGYDTQLWTCGILAELIKQEFNVVVSDSTVRLHLKRLGLSPQKPAYRDYQRDEREIEHFLNVKFPKIQKLAIKMDADIGFEDESGIGVMTRAGTTWGKRGETPVIEVSNQRGGYNALSVVTPDGTLRYSLKEGTIDGKVFIEFLKQVIEPRQRPLILLMDHASFHGSQEVRRFVRQHREKLRVFFLPKRAPELNPDEQFWNEVKNNGIGKQPVKDKADLKMRLYSVFASLQKRTKRVMSFFKLPDTEYADRALFCES